MGGFSTYHYVSFIVVNSSSGGANQLKGKFDSLNAWYHIAGTYDGAKMRLYINGVVVDSLSVTGSFDYTYTNDFRIGIYQDDNDHIYYEGLIDDIRLWNVVRTQSDIANSRFAELAGNEDGLVGYWKLIEGSRDTAHDATTNAKHGLLLNGVTWVGETGLPVELTALSVEVSQSIAQLKWRTATEKNNYGFDVERRVIEYLRRGVVEIKDWLKVGFVEGAGTSNSPREYSFTDSKLLAGRYEYRLKQIDLNGSFKYSHTVEIEIAVPKEFTLSQNYPNPFNPTTIIKYDIPDAGTRSVVSLKVYDLLGREVATLFEGVHQPGSYEVLFDGSRLASGIYFYRLQTGSYGTVKKLLLETLEKYDNRINFSI